MSGSIRLAVCLVALVCTGGSWAQTPDDQTNENVTETTAAPVAHVYVNSGTKILAFSVAANGKLTTVPGSPFNYNLSGMGANGHYLFGYEGGGPIIASLAMAPNGALRKVATTNPADFDSGGCPPTFGAGFRIDHSGQDLYNAAIDDDEFCSTSFQSFRIDEANGKLTFLGDTSGYFDGGPGLNILGNNEYAYTPECTDFDAPTSLRDPDNNYHGAIVPYQRSSNGELVDSNATYSFPAAPNDSSDPTQPSPGFYCPITAATDPTNHIAVLMEAIDVNLAASYGPNVIAIYTADANGNLSTTSTYQNMAVSETGGGGMRMSPSGKILAVNGSGVQLFHFNGGNPPTKYKTLPSNEANGQILWDNDNHMYALGSDANGGKLWVYTVTPTSVTEAPGSPYSITNPGGMFVQPLK
jgi:hypothetical protein